MVQAATREQEREIEELVAYFFSFLFPMYFSPERVEQFYQSGILRPSFRSGTMDESYRILASLQTLIELIESGRLHENEYRKMFDKNARILTELGFDFPFSPDQFQKRDSGKPFWVKAQTAWLM